MGGRHGMSEGGGGGGREEIGRGREGKRGRE